MVWCNGPSVSQIFLRLHIQNIQNQWDVETGLHRILLCSHLLLLPPAGLKSESGISNWNENQLMVGLGGLKGLFQPK